MYSFSIRQFIWEYISFFFWRESSLTVCIRFQLYRQFIWDFFGGKVPLCMRFQLGNSFGIFLEGKFPYVFVFN